MADLQSVAKEVAKKQVLSYLIRVRRVSTAKEAGIARRDRIRLVRAGIFVM